MNYLHLIYAFVISAVVGSFLNVVIYRLPLILQLDELEEKEKKKISLALPPSHCPLCKEKLKWWQNIPIISYLILRGHCYFCKATIPTQYIFVELASGLLAVLSFFLFEDYYQASIATIFCWLLIPLVVIDMKYQILPDEITIFGIWLGILANSTQSFGYTGLINLQTSLYGVVSGYLFIWIIRQFYLFTKEQEMIGLGDAKMLAMVGAFLGVKGLVFSIMLASMFGLLVFLATALKERKLDLTTKMPFGPFIALGALIVLCLRNF